MQDSQHQNTAPDLFQDITSVTNLSMAFARVQVNNGCAGGDGQSTAQLAKRMPEALVLLSGKLRNGSYRPRALRRHVIEKPSGGQRLLTIPSVSDRVVQTAVAQTLSPLIDPHLSPDSYAYRPGKSVDQAVARISALHGMGYRWVLEADIKTAFDVVPHAPILHRLEAMFADMPGIERVTDLIGLWMAQAETGPGIGLAQGSPLSPLMFNLFLDGLDESFGTPKARMVRFADDFVVLCRSEEDALEAQASAGAWLSRFGLELREGATGVVSFDRGFTFLGKLFVRSLVMPAPDEPDAETRDIMAELAEEDAADAAAAAAGHDTGGKVLYVSGPEDRLTLEGRSFAVHAPGGARLLRLSPARIARIELDAQAELSPSVMRHALAHGIQIALVDGHGSEIGQLSPPVTARSAELHLAQARVALDPELSADLARRIVLGRLTNQRVRLSVLNRTAEDIEVTNAIKTLGQIIRKLPHRAETVDQARGYEGRGAAVYWPALARLCTAHKGSFRRERPAKTPLNAAINYITAMLARDCRAALLSAGLHPGFGVLHGAADRHEACTWDLMEGFRALLCDGLAVSLFNRGRLKVEMFEPAERCIVITPEGRRALIMGYEAAIDRVIKSAHSGKRHAMRRILIEEARALGRHYRDPFGSPFTAQTQKS